MDYDTFLSLGVQLIPVLWVVIVLETKWLGAKAQEHGTNRRLTANAWVITWCVPLGGAAMVLALLALLWGWEPFKVITTSYMLVCLVVSTGVAVVSLMRALYDQSSTK